MSAAPAAPPVDSAEPPGTRDAVRLLWSRTATLSLLELAKLRHDRTELYTRAVQPALWLLVFGETFTRIHAIPTTHPGVILAEVGLAAVVCSDASQREGWAVAAVTWRGVPPVLARAGRVWW
jgi:hypothetical protein